MRAVVTTIVLLMVTAAICSAQTYSGTFSAKHDQLSHSLKLKQDADGKVTGTYSDGQNTLDITGEVKDGVMTGKGKLKGFPITFSLRAKRESGMLTLEITEENDGKPDPETTEKIVMTAEGGSSDETPEKPVPAGEKPTKPVKTNPLDKSLTDPFAGTYKAKDILVTLRPAKSGGYEGTITKDGSEFPLTAKKSGPGIEGSFKAGDDNFDFLAKVEGGALQLKTGDTVYILIKEGEVGKAPSANPLDKPKPKNPLAGDKPEAKAAAKDGPVQPAWKILKHPAGTSIRYPRDWTTQSVPNGGFQLIPPGFGPDSKEIYLINGQPAEGITKVDDPRLAQGIDALVAQAVPGLRRTKPGEPINAEQEPGMLFVYEGGNNGTARLYVTIIKDYAIAIVGIGDKAKVEARDGVMRQMFASLGWKEGEKDPVLVGTWSRLGETSLDSRDAVGRLQASSVSNTQRTMVLRPDGTCSSREISRTIALGKGVSIDTGDQVTNREGKWFAGNGKLVLIWDKEAEDYSYQVSNGGGVKQVVIGTGGKKGELWQAR